MTAPDLTAHPDGILVLGESVMFHDGAGTLITAAVDRNTPPAHVVIRIEGDQLTVTPRAARALSAALTGIADTAEIVACLRT